MNNTDIIRDNCECHSPVAWWPKFAFHYTDVTNAVGILDSGVLYSRARAEQLRLMHNDNASRQVIDMTQTEASSYVRFYFRPLTPTQYYNEGFKHPGLRYDNDEHANVPVPVFFLFELDKLLKLQETKFSNTAQSGYGSPLQTGMDAFSKLDFDKIYSNGYTENMEELKKYRHAELLYPRLFPIEDGFQAVLCRNSVERGTLLNLLKEKNEHAFIKYRNKIKVCRSDVFEGNGLFITECVYHNRTLVLQLSETSAKKNYTERMMKRYNISALKPVTVRLVADWVNSRRLCYQSVMETQIDYNKTVSVSFKNLPEIPEAKTIKIQVLIENNLMCYIEQPLRQSELI